MLNNEIFITDEQEQINKHYDTNCKELYRNLKKMSKYSIKHKSFTIINNIGLSITDLNNCKQYESSKSIIPSNPIDFEVKKLTYEKYTIEYDKIKNKYIIT